MKLFDNFFSDIDNPEVQKLERVSMYIFCFLTALIIIGSFVLTLTIESKMIVTSTAFAGIIGSSTAALLSALSRRANGWELSKGEKLPAPINGNDKTKERFSLSMAPFFVFRPFLGIIAGLIVYYGGNLLGLETEVESKMPSQEEIELVKLESFKRIIFFSLLAGLFAKTLIEILKGMFKSFFGRG